MYNAVDCALKELAYTQRDLILIAIDLVCFGWKSSIPTTHTAVADASWKFNTCYVLNMKRSDLICCKHSHLFLI